MPATSAGWAWPGTRISTPTAARRPRRWSSTASSTPPVPGATCTPSTVARADACGNTMRRCRARRRSRPAATSSTAASPYWDGRVYVGTLDGRLVALDARTGAEIWSVLTVDPTKPYTITGAPRVVKGKVIIGNGGGGIRRARLCVRVRRAHRQRWSGASTRCPEIPSQPFENPILATAARTWTGEWWRGGGGGTVWDSIAYDPELDLAVHRRRQRLAVEPEAAQPRRRRQPVPVVDRRAAARHRRIRLALPDNAGRDVGLHRHAAHHARGPRHRRGRAPRADAGAEEWLLLCARPRERQAHVGERRMRR